MFMEEGVMHTEREFLSRRQAGAKLGISADTIRRLIEVGEIQAYRIGRQVRIEVSELERYLDAARLQIAR